LSKIGETLGKNLRALRRAKGLTQEILAELVEVSPSYIGYLERGKKKPSIGLVEKIANALNVTLPMLFYSPEQFGNDELREFIGFLIDKDPKHIRLLHEMAKAYFKFLEDNQP